MGTPRGLVEMGRGGACVPARVALQGRIRRSFPVHDAYVFGMETPLPARVTPQGRIHHSIPRAQCVCFLYRNAAVRTFGRARRRRPYGFVWADCAWDG